MNDPMIVVDMGSQAGATWAELYDLGMRAGLAAGNDLLRSQQEWHDVELAAAEARGRQEAAKVLAQRQAQIEALCVEQDRLRAELVAAEARGWADAVKALRDHKRLREWQHLEPDAYQQSFMPQVVGEFTARYLESIAKEGTPS